MYSLIVDGQAFFQDREWQDTRARGHKGMVFQQNVDGFYDLMAEIPSQRPKTFQIFLSAFKFFAFLFRSWLSRANMRIYREKKDIS